MKRGLRNPRVQSKAAMKIMTFSRILAGTMLLLVATGGAAAADPKRILLIYSFAQEFLTVARI